MINHVSIGTADTVKSRTFYSAALKPLGYNCLSNDDSSAGYGKEQANFWVLKARRPVAPNAESGLHLCFDAPTREFCVVDRATTNTPLQALVLWNDVQFVEAARALATRVLREAGDTGSRIDLLFRLCTARRPGQRERQVLTGMLDDFLERYRGAPDDAKALVMQGESPAAEDLDAVELAAWTMLGSTVLSLDETLVRD